jgi:hypothetical protein
MFAALLVDLAKECDDVVSFKTYHQSTSRISVRQRACVRTNVNNEAGMNTGITNAEPIQTGRRTYRCIRTRTVTAPLTRRDLHIAIKLQRPGMLKLGVIMPRDGVSLYAVRPSWTPTFYGFEGTVPSPQRSSSCNLHVFATSTLCQGNATLPYQVRGKRQARSGATVQRATKEVLRRREPPVGVKKRRLPQHQLENI